MLIDPGPCCLVVVMDLDIKVGFELFDEVCTRKTTELLPITA
jgi:hypothetical protein